MTTLIIYLLIPLIIFLLKSNDSSLLTVFLDLHLKFKLFSLTLLPFIIATIITLYISYKYKLLKVIFSIMRIVPIFTLNNKRRTNQPGVYIKYLFNSLTLRLP
jgi:hypothetical protein